MYHIYTIYIFVLYHLISYYILLPVLYGIPHNIYIYIYIPTVFYRCFNPNDFEASETEPSQQNPLGREIHKPSSTFCEVDSLSKGAFVKVRIDALDLEEDKLKLSMHPPGRVAATGSDWYSAKVSKVNRGGKDGVCGNSLYTPTNRDNGRGLMMGFRITMVDHFVGRS